MLAESGDFKNVVQGVARRKRLRRLGGKTRFFQKHLSSDQHPGYLMYIGDEILPSSIGIVVGH